MPSNNKNIIGKLRQRYEPHMQVSAKVDLNHKIIHEVEKKLTDLPKIHKTLSKSFGMQRKTLIKVLALEKRLGELEAQKVEVDRAIEEIDEAVDEIEDVVDDVVGGESDEEIPQELDGLIDDVRGQESEIGGDDQGSPSNVGVLDGEGIDDGGGDGPGGTVTPGKKKPKKKKPRKKKPKIKIRKRKIKPQDIKKGTALDKDFSSRVLGENEKGEYLSKQERIARFKGEKFDPSSVTPEDGSDGSDGSAGKDGAAEKVLSGLGGSISTIADTVDSIFNTLKEQFEVQKDTKDENRVQREQADAKNEEKKLEKGGIGKGVKDTTKKALQPFTSLWDKFVNFLTTLLFGKAVMKVVDWFANPENGEKIKSFVRFLKDWWPVLLASIMAFIPALLGPGGMILGTIILLAWSIPKIISAVKWLMDLPAQIGKFLKGGEKGNANLEQDALKEIDKEAAGLNNVDPETGNPLDKAQAEVGEEKPPIDPSTLGETQKPIAMNQGGEVPGTGDKDTVPAMLTPGEFVMSKGAVERYGEDTLAGMNAAAGGTNIPTLQQDDDKKKKPNFNIPHYSGGGKGQSAGGGDDYWAGRDTSHFGQQGYRMGQKMPEQFVFHDQKFKHHIIEENGEIVKNEKTFTDIGGAIAMEDLQAHQKQLVGAIQKVPGYEGINFMDVVQYPDDRGNLVGIKPETLYPILNNSDAAKATDAKRKAATEMDRENNTLHLNPKKVEAKLKEMGHWNGGGLVQHFNNGGLVQKFAGGGFINNIPQVKAAKWLGSKLQSAGGKIVNMAKAKISDVKKNIGDKIGPPSGKTTVVVASSPSGKSSELPRMDFMGSGDIPQFAARHPSGKASKQKTLGITV